MSKPLLTFLFIASFFTSLSGQDCEENQVTIVLKVVTDKWAENSWTLGSGDSIYTKVDDESYFQKETFIDTFCVGQLECLTFTIFDGFGDGITEGGGFEIYVDGALVHQESQFGLSKSYEVNCQPGTSCAQAISVSQGNHRAPTRDAWYEFQPDSIGTYTISTCDLNECDTRIWVYDRCESFIPGGLEGFIFFDDNTGNCGFQAVVNAFFQAGETYLIRISDVDGDCDGPINWSLMYQGPVIGCTDPNSCNFNPLATIDDGSCRPQGDPLCPNGPDLAVREDILFSSIYADTIRTDDECWIEEGCLTGTGLREIIRFTTRFENIGELDYYIGEPTLDNQQFVFDNCHNHFHYENYAEYLLFDQAGNILPNGFKSGFCVIDLNCPTGNNKYGCNNMGLSVGCYDEYGSDLDCQWIDVTDIPDGELTFVARVNWNNQPDALGRVEKNLANNWAQVCMVLDRSSGKLEVTMKEDCPTYVDCVGVAYGDTRPDCEGVCGGQRMAGDLNRSNVQDDSDVMAYFSAILEKDESITPCNDLNNDEKLTVYDAALLSDCINFSEGHLHPNNEIHSHCEFPYGIVNSADKVSLVISSVNTKEKFVDVAIKNPDSEVVGYQFSISGVQIESIENLVPVTEFPAMIQANIASGEIIGLSLKDSTIEKSRGFQPLVRIRFSDFTNSQLCLANIADVVNRSYQQVTTEIANSCINVITSDNEVVLEEKVVSVYPNPFSQSTTLSFSNPQKAIYTLVINDLSGKTVKQVPNITDENIVLERADLTTGLYYFQLVGEAGIFTGKLLIQ
ncbi:MAG: lysyl oxidase family protein [Bacteroidota bacterium]